MGGWEVRDEEGVGRAVRSSRSRCRPEETEERVIDGGRGYGGRGSRGSVHRRGGHGISDMGIAIVSRAGDMICKLKEKVKTEHR